MCVVCCLPQERQRMKEFLLTIVLEGLEEKHNMLLSRGTYNISTHLSECVYMYVLCFTLCGCRQIAEY